MDNEELQHIRRLLEVTRDRRQELEVQAARYGPYRVPAEIAIELRETEESIARLEAKIKIVTVPQMIQDATGPEASIDVLRLSVKELKDQVGTVYRYTEKLLLEMRAESQDWRTEQDRKRVLGTRERRAIEVLLALGVIVALYLAIR